MRSNLISYVAFKTTHNCLNMTTKMKRVCSTTPKALKCKEKWCRIIMMTTMMTMFPCLRLGVRLAHLLAHLRDRLRDHLQGLPLDLPLAHLQGRVVATALLVAGERVLATYPWLTPKDRDGRKWASWEAQRETWIATMKM